MTEGEAATGDVCRGWGSRLARGARVLATLLAVAACGEAPSPPNEIIQNYLNALGAGNYLNACSYLDAGAREGLVRSARKPTTCAGIFQRCLPHRTIVLKQDQTQLLYANIEVTRSGSEATAALSRTLVARELKRVSLRNENGAWKLTGVGQAIQRCRILRHPRQAKPAA